MDVPAAIGGERGAKVTPFDLSKDARDRTSESSLLTAAVHKQLLHASSRQHSPSLERPDRRTLHDFGQLLTHAQDSLSMHRSVDRGCAPQWLRDTATSTTHRTGRTASSIRACQVE